MIRGVALPAVLLIACPAGAAEIISLQITNNKGEYRVEALMTLDAPPSEVRYVITDYNNLTRITGAVQKSQLLESPAESVRVVHTRSKVCFLFFCQEMDMIERIDENADGKGLIRAEALPDYSDVEYAVTTWRIEPHEKGTFLRWNTTLRPKFWLPPLIGPAIMKSSLRGQAQKTARGIEKLAREWAVIHGTANDAG